MQDFSVTAMARAICAETFKTIRNHEWSEHQRLVEQYGPASSNHYRAPGTLFRDLSAASASGGGFLVNSQIVGFVPSLLAQTVCGVHGAQYLTLDGGPALAVVGGTAIVTSWLTNESQQIGEGSPTFTQAAASPKLLGAYVEVSRQLLLQSNAEALLRSEMRRAAAAALDIAALAGSGVSGQPTGVLSASGTGSFTGASLSASAIRNAQTDIAPSTQPGTVVGMVTTPAITETLSTRPRVASSDRMLLEGPSHDGTVEGIRCLGTSAMPAATAIVGNFAAMTFIEWGAGIEIMVDPYTKFQQGIVAIRLLLPCDVLLLRPSAFSIATGIS